MVYLSEDLTELLRKYVFKLSSVFLCQSVWFFPARNPEQQLSNVTIDKRFRDSWAKTVTETRPSIASAIVLS